MLSSRRLASFRQAFFGFCLLNISTFSFAAVLGSTPGAFAVNSNGAATYSLPVFIPEATGGVQPNLSVTYNSQAGNGSMGMGWSLGGLSAITRCAATRDGTDGTPYNGGPHHDNKDRYCLDGQKLLSVSGTYGANGTEYRTEINTYAQIHSYGNNANANGGNSPLRFRVRTKDGLIKYYGWTANSTSKPLASTSIDAWLLYSVSDRYGNNYIISYMGDGDSWRLPKYISTSRNDQQGVGAMVGITFEYEARNDKRKSYRIGGYYPSNTRLKKIKVHSGSTVIRDYRFSYQHSPNTGNSRLLSISECGKGWSMFSTN